MTFGKTNGLVAAFLYCLASIAGQAQNSRTELHGHVPAVVSRLTATGRLAPTNELTLAIGLPWRHAAELDELIRQLYDPRSPNFHQFLTPAEFTERFGPTEADYLAVQNFARTNGFTITGTHGNRLVLDVRGKSGDAERAFHIALKTYRHPRERRNFFAPDTEPSVPTNFAVADVWGLSDYPVARPLSRKIDPAKIKPLGGSGPSGYYAGNDFRNAYAPGTTLTGAGQVVASLQFSDYFKSDITNYQRMIGLTNFVPLTNVVLSGGTPSTANNNETALDIEMAIAMAPQLTRIVVYEIRSVNPSSILSRMANDNLAKNLSSSWSWSGGPSTSVDNALKQMMTQGQSFFQASGDSDAYTGPQVLDNAGQTTAPMDSTNVISVGGTTLSMSSSGAAWSSETTWNYNSYGGTFANIGSGGGISTYYAIPSWQVNIDTNASQGSAIFRNIPDVALTADGVSVCYTSGGAVTNALAGTSCAAPLWAGFCALINQQAAASGSGSAGFLNPAFYALAASTNYSNCFHDITTGNNIGTNTPGMFSATNGYDLATGLGTPNGMGLINTLFPAPGLLNQPASLNVTNGANVNFNLAAAGAPPLNFQWQLNGTNLFAGGNVSGVASNLLSIAAVTTNNAGSYRLIVANASGSITSSVAVLTVGVPPAIAAQPTNLTLLTGGTAVFSATVSGSSSLAYQWRKNGTNFGGSGITGTNAATLTLAGITTNSAANYSVIVTNLFGAVTSGVASLAVVLPPGITSSSVTNRTLQCGSNTNTFTVSTNGTAPLFIQWSLDGAPVTGATNLSFSLTNLFSPNHTVGVTVTNHYATTTSNATLTVSDTLAPAITMHGAAIITNELGSAFSDPGATASDLCAGIVAVVTNGTVNVDVVGTNTLTYKAGDGNGNTNTATRTVIVRDTTPPAISWSFTNLVVAANSSCAALMTNVAGTNFILATDLSGALTITQSPTNNALLALGTNTVVITVADASGNKSFSTNRVVVLDQTPPVIVLNGSALMTNELGSAFVDPGATAADSCSELVSFVTNGIVNTSIVGTNVLTYHAVDAGSNTIIATRTIIVRDTVPPVLAWNFTNLSLVLDTNCAALMPDVTGTNFISATDLSGAVTVSQSPTNGFALPLGTNVIVVTATDASGNSASATNQIIVRDALPQFVAPPLAQTNTVGGSTSFSVTATACTALAFQWFINNGALSAQTNNTLTLSNLVTGNAGNYSVVVTSAGGSVTSAPVLLVVNLQASSLALVSSSNPDGFKDTLNFTATVSPTNANGFVQFLTNGVAFDSQPLASGVAVSTNVSTLPRGANLITAIYSGDGNYLAVSNFFAQIVTNHPPQVAPVMFNLVAGLNLTIPVATLATNWSDADGDALFIAGISASTNGVIVSNAVPLLFYSNSNLVGDQFVCAVADGFGGTNFQTVNIFIVPQTNATPFIANVVAPPGNGVTLQLNGGYGSTYVLEGADDLIGGAWLPIATNTLGITGVWQFTDFGVTNNPARFYRLKLMP